MLCPWARTTCTEGQVPQWLGKVSSERWDGALADNGWLSAILVKSLV